MRPRHACLAFAVAALAATSRPAPAEVIEVPPVTIHHLRHFFEPNVVSPVDMAYLAGTDYSGNGFSATIDDGDLVRVRVQAPAGKKFRVRGAVAPPPARGHFGLSLNWIGSGPNVVHTNLWSATFENFVGVQPTIAYSLVTASPRFIETWISYDTHGDFEFTAVRIEMTVQQAVPGAAATFGLPGSDSTPFGAGVVDTNQDTISMEIVDDAPVPVGTSSWGRLKSLYR